MNDLDAMWRFSQQNVAAAYLFARRLYARGAFAHAIVMQLAAAHLSEQMRVAVEANNRLVMLERAARDAS